MSIEFDREREKPYAERKVRRSGGSTGITLPQPLLDVVGLERGDLARLDVTDEEDGIVIRSAGFNEDSDGEVIGRE